ncbi:MAG: hypothetical protein MUF49_30920 [Oculatellaceae cyanobacterium Prado106]|nr:hypothetical protein [Oculatellaceae cyanobacterium Prado106]
MTKVASFDVFDTVLTRSVGSPAASFLLLGRKLHQLGSLPCTPEAFARIRAQAEARAFENAGGLDSSVSLHSIYAEVGFTLRIPEASWKVWLNHELQMEFDILRVVPEAQAMLNYCRQQGQRILFISDMYLDHAFILKILIHHNLYQEGDRLYVSSEFQKSKLERTLYKLVLEQEHLTASEVTHYGNHPWSDVDAPQSLGMQTHPFLQGNLNRYEQILESGLWDSEGLSSAMAGASRLTRLSIPVQTQSEALLRDVAASVAAPTLVHFVLWVLNRAKTLGLKRLYFLARDGQVLLAIAQQLIQKLDLDCELRYLYGSRQSWLIPSLTHLDDDSLALLFLKKFDVIFLSVRILLARFCLTPEMVQHSLAKIQLTEATWDQNLTLEKREQLRQLMLQDPDFRAAILDQAAQKRQVMLRYLQQERVTEGNFGLVDLGSGSSLHNALASVLETVGVAPPKSFYLGIRAGVPNTRFGLPEPYLNHSPLSLGFQIPSITSFLEMVCSADHGTVVTYRQSGQCVEPVFKEETNQAILDWGYRVVQASICRFADLLMLNPTYLNQQSDIRSTLTQLQHEFWHHLTPAEAKVWGRFPMEDGWGDQSFLTPLARPYRLRNLLYPLKTGLLHNGRHWWHEAAFQMSSKLMQRLYTLNYTIGKQIQTQRLRIRKLIALR